MFLAPPLPCSVFRLWRAGAMGKDGRMGHGVFKWVRPVSAEQPFNSPFFGQNYSRDPPVHKGPGEWPWEHTASSPRRTERTVGSELGAALACCSCGWSQISLLLPASQAQSAVSLPGFQPCPALTGRGVRQLSEVMAAFQTLTGRRARTGHSSTSSTPEIYALRSTSGFPRETQMTPRNKYDLQSWTGMPKRTGSAVYLEMH